VLEDLSIFLTLYGSKRLAIPILNGVVRSKKRPNKQRAHDQTAGLPPTGILFAFLDSLILLSRKTYNIPLQHVNRRGH